MARPRATLQQAASGNRGSTSRDAPRVLHAACQDLNHHSAIGVHHAKNLKVIHTVPVQYGAAIHSHRLATLPAPLCQPSTTRSLRDEYLQFLKQPGVRSRCDVHHGLKTPDGTSGSRVSGCARLASAGAAFLVPRPAGQQRALLYLRAIVAARALLRIFLTCARHPQPVLRTGASAGRALTSCRRVGIPA